MRVLCVAEKPSIAKSVTQILSGGQFNTRATGNKYIKNYEFNYPQNNAHFTMTSVAGHITTHDFDKSLMKWSSCDPFVLFDAPVRRYVREGSEDIEKNLRNETKRSDMLMIWTDCDREGENIGMEIARICRKVKPNISIKRARFSAIIAQQIHRAAQHPVELDRAQADAVEARTILDLRLGAAFTRMQTLALQRDVAQLREGVISYGPCQFPTLGFVVARYKQVQDFVSEPFWKIDLSLSRPTSSKENVTTPFTWRRGHIFDFNVAVALYQEVLSNPTARVTKVVSKATKKWKPLPLTTVELQKAASRLLHLGPKKVLDIAEKLYQDGFLSYPRTETDQFDAKFDLMGLIDKQTADPAWGEFATSLQQGGFSPPRKGKNDDKAHPPIHPTAYAGNLAGDHKRVYEYVTRRFLACCSKDAEGWEKTVEVLCGGEDFFVTGLVVLERNYLLVYPYDKWNGKEIPEFAEGEVIQPTSCELTEGNTSSPTCLTEADLVTLMDKNGIGTDATIAIHIQTIIDREYVVERMQGRTKYLLPSKLGVGLIEGYNQIGFDRSLSKPHLRHETERQMLQVCQGHRSKIDMLDQNIHQYREIFILARREFAKVVSTVRRNLQNDFRDDDALGGGRGDGGGESGDDRPNGGDGGNRNRNSGRGRGGARGKRGTKTNRTNGKDQRSESLQKFQRNSGNDAPPSNRGRKSTTAKPADPMSNVNCRCDKPAAKRVVAKTSASRGREYWTCSNKKCSFFEWVNGIPPGNASEVQTSKTIPAKRTYSEHAEQQHSNVTSAKTVKCQCMNEATRRTTQNQGRHHGRLYWVCAKKSNRCSFFVWDDEVGNKEPTRDIPQTCFKCGDHGHLSSDCQKHDPKSSVPAGGPCPKGCFICGSEDHFKRECPENMAFRDCFRCGKPGHWKENCPLAEED